MGGDEEGERKEEEHLAVEATGGRKRCCRFEGLALPFYFVSSCAPVSGASGAGI